MALQLTIELPSGAQGNYIKILEIERGIGRRYLCCHFYLYASKAKADENKPIWPTCIAKLRLEDAKYDKYLSTAALAALPNPGPDAERTAIYAAARVEPLIAGGGLTSLSFADAVDV
jgi:hypothetical protein